MTKQAISALIAAGVGAGVAWAASGGGPSDSDAEPFTFEIAEDANQFAFDEAPVFEDGMPAYGNPFVTQGYIYEAGTLADGGGVNADGSLIAGTGSHGGAEGKQVQALEGFNGSGGVNLTVTLIPETGS